MEGFFEMLVGVVYRRESHRIDFAVVSGVAVARDAY